MAKKVSLYGILSALCIVLGFVEHLLPLDFIAPGIKLGLANCVALLLVSLDDIKGAFAVNIVRILLSALLFSSPFTLIYSFSGGVLSLIVIALLKKTQKFGILGLSVAAATVHNTAQLTIAFFLVGSGVLYYSGFLLISAVLSGLCIGIISKLVLKKLKFKY